MRGLDIAIVIVYILAMPVLGVLLGGRQRTSADYFIGSRKVPWWAACFSVVATETSVLTVISVPTVAYLGTFTYLQLAIGYLIGRIFVALVLLPRYYSGNLVSAYQFLGKRFGTGLQGTASVTFLVTRLFADGLRLFATAIPVQLLLDGMGIRLDFFWIVLGIAAFSVIYTYVGGIRAVIWVDVIQMGLYLLGAAVAITVLAGKLPDGWFSAAWDEGRFQLFDFSSNVITNHYAFVTAVFGGALFAMASHGADQLMVQRLLACRNVRDSQRAVIVSGVVVLLQFAVFLFVGAMLAAFFSHRTPSDPVAAGGLGLPSDDAVFPSFIINELPAGLSGLLVAGILAAAMSTISSSLNSLSTSTVSDLYRTITRRDPSDARILRSGRLWTLVWAAVFVVFASLFTDTGQPVVEIGLSLASYTYGALLGAFLLGLIVRKARQTDALAAFLTTVAVTVLLVFFVRFNADGVPHFVAFNTTAEDEFKLAFPLYTVIGVVITLLVGGLLALRHREPPETDVAAAVDAKAA